MSKNNDFEKFVLMQIRMEELIDRAATEGRDPTEEEIRATMVDPDSVLEGCLRALIITGCSLFLLVALLMIFVVAVNRF